MYNTNVMTLATASLKPNYYKKNHSENLKNKLWNMFSKKMEPAVVVVQFLKKKQSYLKRANRINLGRSLSD